MRPPLWRTPPTWGAHTRSWQAQAQRGGWGVGGFGGGGRHNPPPTVTDPLQVGFVFRHAHPHPHPPSPPARPDTLDRVSSHWMPELARLGVAAPCVLVGCKADAAPADAARLTAVVAPVMHRHKQIETCLECSAKKLVFVGEVRI